MARKKRRTIWQFLREEPVVAVRIVGSLVSVAVTEFALPISEELQGLIVTVILLYLAGPGALEIWLSRRSVSPTTKLRRLAKEGEGPHLNDEVGDLLGRR